MRTYGQYCPISRATEILGERWTILVIRNLLVGCTGFNEIAGGVPGMSRSLLSSRLRSLEDAGIVETTDKPDGRGKSYTLTAAGRGLWDVIKPMAEWAQQWVALQPEHTDPSFALWAWVHAHLRRDQLPDRRVVVEFYFPEQPEMYRRFWVLFEREHTELCYADPGYEVDVEVIALSKAFTNWHIGRIEWSDAVATGDIRVRGAQPWADALPTWNERVV